MLYTGFIFFKGVQNINKQPFSSSSFMKENYFTITIPKKFIIQGVNIKVCTQTCF